MTKWCFFYSGSILFYANKSLFTNSRVWEYPTCEHFRDTTVVNRMRHWQNLIALYDPFDDAESYTVALPRLTVSSNCTQVSHVMFDFADENICFLTPYKCRGCRYKILFNCEKLVGTPIKRFARPMTLKLWAEHRFH